MCLNCYPHQYVATWHHNRYWCSSCCCFHYAPCQPVWPPAVALPAPPPRPHVHPSAQSAIKALAG